MTTVSPQPGSDEALMLQYAKGDMTAFQTLYQRHRGGLYRYFLRQTPQAVAEELFQDVWARVIDSRKRYKPTAKFTTWLYTLAHNRLVDHWRREGIRPSGDDDNDAVVNRPDPVEDPPRLVDLRDCLEQLKQLVAELPDVQRQAFLMRHEAGLSLADMAEAMATKMETAKSRLRYAMSRIRAALAPECLEDQP